MAEQQAIELFLAKAEQCLEGAENAFSSWRYDNCVNRCYYACFQAAVAALIRASIRPAGEDRWRHAFVHSQFVGQLINRRKLYPAALREVLGETLALRRTADYKQESVTERQARRALTLARGLVQTVQEGRATR